MKPLNEIRLIQSSWRPKSYRRKNSGNQIPANEEARWCAIRRAEQLQSGLGSESPSLVKTMYHSHVKRSFLLNFPISFCKCYLPNHDECITLLDENGYISTAKYLSRQHALSGGWIRFAKDHKLLDGDALVFQLIQPTKFKVYIVRVNDVAIAESLNPYNADVHAKETDFNKNRIDGAAIEKRNRHVPPAVLQGNIQHMLDPSVEEKGNMHSFDTEDFTLSGCVPDFENFSIIVNGKSVDHEFSKQVRANYYNLCCSQKSYLHKHLCESISGTRAIEIITRTVDMANAIRGCKLFSSTNDFGEWEKNLVEFEMMGMNIGFIRDRLKRLASPISDPSVAEELKRYGEAKREQDRTEEEIMSHELNLVKLNQTKERITKEMVTIRMKLHGYQSIFQGEASAPW